MDALMAATLLPFDPSREKAMKRDRSAAIFAGERSSSTRGSVIDVLDRVLDKGIVIDARVRVAAGIDLITVDARIVVASIETYFQHAGAIAEALAISTGHLPERERQQ